MVHDPPVIGLGDAIQFHGGRLVHQVEKFRKGLAQADATPAAVTDIENPLQLLEQVLLVVELGIGPIETVPGGSFKASFASGHGLAPEWSGCRRAANEHKPDEPFLSRD
jgi:hypothetical protein